MVTGTYNQDLNYSIYYKTNKNDYKLLKENLNTGVNNYIDFSNLELEADEYITEFKADFGTVDVGFESVINPYIFVRVNSDVKNDDIFTNETRIEGYNKSYMVWDEDDHTTKVYEKEVEIKKLPRTRQIKYGESFELSLKLFYTETSINFTLSRILEKIEKYVDKYFRQS